MNSNLLPKPRVILILHLRKQNTTELLQKQKEIYPRLILHLVHCDATMVTSRKKKIAFITLKWEHSVVAVEWFLY